MAISTDTAIDFFGTQDTVITTGSTVADGAFSQSGDVASWANDDDAREAIAVLTCAFSSTPAAYSSVALCARLMNIDGTGDAHTPDANNLHYLIGEFPLNDSTSTQYIAIPVKLPNVQTSQVYEFFIQNNGGQTMSSGATVKITPKAAGPHG